MSNDKFHKWISEQVQYLESVPLTPVGETRLEVYKKVLAEYSVHASPLPPSPSAGLTAEEYWDSKSNKFAAIPNLQLMTKEDFLQYASQLQSVPLVSAETILSAKINKCIPVDKNLYADIIAAMHEFRNQQPAVGREVVDLKPIIDLVTELQRANAKGFAYKVSDISIEIKNRLSSCVVESKGAGMAECVGYGYLCELDGEKVFVVAENIAAAFDILAAKGGKYSLLISKSLNLLSESPVTGGEIGCSCNKSFGGYAGCPIHDPNLKRSTPSTSTDAGQLFTREQMGEKCKRCNGTGNEAGSQNIYSECIECGGTGEVDSTQPVSEGKEEEPDEPTDDQIYNQPGWEGGIKY